VYLLDTDTISNAWTKGRNYPRLRSRIVAELPRVYLSTVSIAEYLRYLQAGIRREWDAPDAVGYQALHTFLQDLRDYNILPFTPEDQERYLTIPRKLRSKRPRDCRIAASAMTRGFYVVTYNTAHFQEIGTRTETWAEADLEDAPEWYRPDEEAPW
jgi:predicted nucleic acid-binding protein